MSIIIKDDEIRIMNEYYGTDANPDDAQQYKLCQVIFSLEDVLREHDIDPRPKAEKLS